MILMSHTILLNRSYLKELLLKSILSPQNCQVQQVSGQEKFALDKSFQEAGKACYPKAEPGCVITGPLVSSNSPLFISSDPVVKEQSQPGSDSPVLSSSLTATR